MRRPLRKLPGGPGRGPANAPTPPPASTPAVPEARPAGPRPPGAPAPSAGDKGLTLAQWTDVILKNPGYATAYAERGAILYKAGRIENALYDFNTALKLEATNTRALFWRGWLQLSRKKIREAAADFQKCAGLDTKSAEACYGAGLALHRLGELEAAERILDQALVRNADHMKSVTLRGRVKVARGSYETALPDLDRSLAADPRDAAARTARARASLARGNFGRALEDLAAAIEIDPKYAEAYAVRGLIPLKKREYDAALAEVARAKELDPLVPIEAKYAEAFADRGKRRLATSDATGAAGDLETAWALEKGAVSPDLFADALRRRGQSYVDAGRAEEAARDFDAAQELALSEAPAEGHVEAILRRGLQRLKEQKFEEALADLDRAFVLNADLSVDPAFAQAYGMRGTARLKADDASGALDDLTRAIALAPSEPTWRVARARLFLERGDTALAAGDAEVLVKIANEVPEEITGTLVQRAAERVRAGDVDGAVADYRRALRFHPEIARDATYGAALRARADARAREGKAVEALEDLDEMVRIDPTAPVPTILAPALVRRAAGRTAPDIALIDLDRAIAIDPALAAAWEARGRLKESRMDYADAREDLRKAVELDPSLQGRVQPLIAKLDDLLR